MHFVLAAVLSALRVVQERTAFAVLGLAKRGNCRNSVTQPKHVHPFFDALFTEPLLGLHRLEGASL